MHFLSMSVHTYSSATMSVIGPQQSADHEPEYPAPQLGKDRAMCMCAGQPKHNT